MRPGSGSGALGIVTAVTFRVEPAFTLPPSRTPMSWAEVVRRLRRPRRRGTSTSRRTGSRTPTGCWSSATTAPTTPAPLSRRARAYVDDELLSNTAFGAVNRVGQRRPRPRAPAQPGRPRARCRPAPTATPRTGCSSSSRRVLFREMEYAVPREVGMQALTEARALIEQQDWRISFPVEIRHAPPRRHLAVDRARPRLGLPGVPRQRPDRPHGRTSPGSSRCSGATTAGRTGASCTPARPRTCASTYPRLRRLRRRCATGSTRTGCSPTATSTGCSDPETRLDPPVRPPTAAESNK